MELFLEIPTHQESIKRLQELRKEPSSSADVSPAPTSASSFGPSAPIVSPSLTVSTSSPTPSVYSVTPSPSRQLKSFFGRRSPLKACCSLRVEDHIAGTFASEDDRTPEPSGFSSPDRFQLADEIFQFDLGTPSAAKGALQQRRVDETFILAQKLLLQQQQQQQQEQEEQDEINNNNNNTNNNNDDVDDGNFDDDDDNCVEYSDCSVVVRGGDRIVQVETNYEFDDNDDGNDEGEVQPLHTRVVDKWEVALLRGKASSSKSNFENDQQDRKINPALPPKSRLLSRDSSFQSSASTMIVGGSDDNNKRQQQQLFSPF